MKTKQLRLATTALLSLALLSSAGVVITSCGKSPGVATHSLSDDAARARKLLDTGSYDAATEVLKEALTKSKTDAGVLCQYVRCLILSRDPAYPNFIQSPLIPDGDYYWALGIAQRAANLAAELEPECKAYLADKILQAFEERAHITFKEGRACIGEPRSLYYAETGQYRTGSGIELSMVNICWAAITLDPDTARAWASRYKELMQSAIEHGKVTSAMMFGNLYGDMLQGGNGAEDFKQANQAFFAALDNYKSNQSHDFLHDTVTAYPFLFRDELLGNPQEIDPLFARLESRLEARGEIIPRPTRETPHNLEFPTGAPPR